ncbi:hypothetical protein TNCV_2396901 [Trichonephila clavipes]|uniref:Uncharacterized protein n=1 Tax=Trichonephila clavipes TaxID=2585209 RepID=A0A8X6SZS0_TRICX|nr:hypothetical protein TNCV_2396901 [Trichonephila clavipes]
MPKEVEELVFVWASRLSPYPWFVSIIHFHLLSGQKIGRITVSAQAGNIYLVNVSFGVSECMSAGNNGNTVFLSHVPHLGLGRGLPPYTIITHLGEK